MLWKVWLTLAFSQIIVNSNNSYGYFCGLSNCWSILVMIHTIHQVVAVIQRSDFANN